MSGMKGAEFDEMFLTMMISHHEGAIAMAKTEVASGKNAQAKELAQKVISDQTADLGRITRQQIFIRRAVSKAVSKGLTNPVVLNDLVSAGVDNVRLDGNLYSGGLIEASGQPIQSSLHWKNSEPARKDGTERRCAHQRPGHWPPGRQAPGSFRRPRRRDPAPAPPAAAGWPRPAAGWPRPAPRRAPAESSAAWAG